MLTSSVFIAIVSALLLPEVIMAFNPFHLHVRGLEPRTLVTRNLILSQSTKSPIPTETIGFLGIPIAVNQSPSPRTAVSQTTAVFGPAIKQNGKVAQTTTQEQGIFSTSITLPMNTDDVTSTKSASATGASSSSFFTQHSITESLPNWAVLVIIIALSTIFLALVGVFVWQVINYRKGRKVGHLGGKTVDDDEDILETYTNYWKRRNSRGILGQENVVSPADEKFGRKWYI